MYLFIKAGVEHRVFNLHFIFHPNIVPKVISFSLMSFYQHPWESVSTASVIAWLMSSFAFSLITSPLAMNYLSFQMYLGLGTLFL